MNVAFTGCRPVLPVADLRGSLAFYVDRLGFREGWGQADAILDGPQADRPSVCYVFCSHFELLLREVDEPHPGEVVVGCASREHVDRAYDAYCEAGVSVAEAPSATEWGTYEMRLHDPDGNLLRILH